MKVGGDYLGFEIWRTGYRKDKGFRESKADRVILTKDHEW